MRTFRRPCLAVAVAVASAVLLQRAAAVPSDHSAGKQLISALMYKFGKFVKWPDQAFASDDAPFVIGLIGPDPLGTVLDDTVEDKKIRGRIIKITRLKSTDDAAAIKSCHILFVSGHQLDAILESLAGAPVVTVGEIDGFVAKGGMIRFFTKGKKIGLEI
ncbi:MAG: YfiR family protein, partial [Planctomycetota bacterium]